MKRVDIPYLNYLIDIIKDIERSMSKSKTFCVLPTPKDVDLSEVFETEKKTLQNNVHCLQKLKISVTSTLTSMKLKAVVYFFSVLSKKDFYENKDAIYSNIKRIEIISEVIKNISPNLKEKYPEIEWSKIERIKDLLKNHYFGIDINTVWELLRIDIPVLKEKLIKISGLER